MTTEVGVFRPVEGRLIVQGPLWWVSATTQRWQSRPEFSGQYTAPRRSFQRLIRSGVERFGSVRVITESRGTSRVCDTRCRDAIGPSKDCECICLGLAHGTGVGYVAPNGTTMIEDRVRRTDMVVTRENLRNGT